MKIFQISTCFSRISVETQNQINHTGSDFGTDGRLSDVASEAEAGRGSAAAVCGGDGEARSAAEQERTKERLPRHNALVKV